MTEDARERLVNATREIVADARRRLEIEKGHSLCSEECDCPDAIRLVEDFLDHANQAIEKHGTSTTPMSADPTEGDASG